MIERTRGIYFKDTLNYLYEEVMDPFSNGEMPIGPSDEDLENYYSFAYYAFTLGYYELSEKIFQYLTSYAPYTGYYWRALGAVQQQTMNYSGAISSYEMAIANDPEDIISSVYQSECLILMNNHEKAVNYLSKFLKNTPKNEENSVWFDRAKLLLSIHKKSEGRESVNA